MSSYDDRESSVDHQDFDEYAQMPLDFDDEQEAQNRGRRNSRRARDYTNDERIDYEDDDEEDDDEDYVMNDRTRNKKKKRNIFLDVEAAVDEAEEEEEEGDEDFEGFIQEEHEEAAAATHREGRHRALDRRREIQDFDAEEVAARLSAKYGRRDTYRRVETYVPEGDYVPQKFLMPGVQDPNLWMIKCAPGKEKDIVLQMMRRYFDREYSDRPLEIMSVFCRDSLKGYIYVEARKKAHVQAAVDRVTGVFASKLTLVPIEEMVDVVRIRRTESHIQPKSWVRVKRGKYAGDLAQVLEVEDSQDVVKIRLVPRLEVSGYRDNMDDNLAKKRKKGVPYNSASEPRPPQRLFNPKDSSRLDLNKPIMFRGSNSYMYGNDLFRDGFLEKTVKSTSLFTEHINPTLDEVAKFSMGDGTDEENAQSLSALAGSAAVQSAKAITLRPGDQVEVIEGDMIHVHGVVISVDGDVVQVHPEVSGLPDSLRFSTSQLRKRYKEGDHVKVAGGHHGGETGMIISVTDNVVTLLSDLAMKEIIVFSKDLREVADSSAPINSHTVSGRFELYDFVTVDESPAVIIKIEGRNFQILDQHNSTRLVQDGQITPRKSHRNAAATDSQRNIIRVGDQVRSILGDGKSGTVLHINRFCCFVRSRDQTENAGVFVLPPQKVLAIGARPGSRSGDGALNSFPHPGAPNNRGRGARGRGGGVAFFNRRGPRDPLLSATVMITQGPYKTYIGIVKEASGNSARVELHTNSRLITIEKAQLAVQTQDGTFEPFSKLPEYASPQNGPRRSGRPTSAYNNGWGSSTDEQSRNFYGGSQTPMHRNNGSRTPFHVGDGSRTPAWDSGSRTPNPRAFGWDDSSGSGWGDGEPSVDAASAWDAGSRTPHWGGGGDDYGNGRSQSGDGWGSPPSTVARSDYAPTPGSVYNPTTPQASLDYPQTPTPGHFSAATPNTWGGSDRHPPQTPGRFAQGGTPYNNAPTPGAGAPITPAPGLGVPQTPYGGGGVGDSSSYGSGRGTYGNGSGADTGRRGVGSDSTQGYANDGRGSSAGLPHNWPTEGIAVTISENSAQLDKVPRGSQGVVTRVEGGGNCMIRITECESDASLEGTVHTIPESHLAPVRPSRRDQIKVLGGTDNQGTVGVLVAFDGADVIIQFSGSSELKIIPLEKVAKYEGVTF
ncbi:transcription elongation factor spt5 [Dispira simplex]|nr:transcription elongation factor spt5 [Dispira simplex]